ncbi:hypothetical protein DAPPUDRAFT_243522 [Daphnia pulex]|uniref:Uncharacterized protein n=1 Tax=Daphnia pulex TaxID=6669 RepID=E9GJ09_DAPPU|nr:hypothetical protein DAPPUDRAFT_243522 [Daphnia pulex]|eukprot:EFX80563.1 hypothetical protein DAPPUDRAFT_243522 [Daphnia pulex]
MAVNNSPCAILKLAKGKVNRDEVIYVRLGRWKKENCFGFPLASEEEDMARYASVPIHYVCTRVFFLREEENRETFQMSRESVRLPIYASDFRQVEHTPNGVGEEAK